MIFAAFWALSYLLAAPAPVLGQSAAAMRVQRGLVYTTDATGSYRADLYEPDVPATLGAPAQHPAVVAIHGGSWRSGSRKEMAKLCRDLATRGLVCLAIDYDLHPRSFPQSWMEGRAAIEFLRDHAAVYGVDPRRIAVLGTSAGGQIAALLALAPDGPVLTERYTPPLGAAQAVPVEAAVSLNGGYDLHPRAYLLRRYLGGRCPAIRRVCDDASPDNHVHPGEPPFFVGHGTADHLIPYTQATGFVARLRAAGDPVTPFVANGAGHSYWRKKRWYPVNLAAVEGFLQGVFGGS